MDKKTVGISSLIAIGLIVASMAVPTFFDEPKYYCESRDIGIFECDGFSKYVDPNGKCLNATIDDINYGNKICKTGWLEITDDLIIQEEPEIIEIDSVNGIKWECSPENCVKIS